MTPKRIALLGATGTIGTATLKLLTSRGHPVTALIRPRPGNAAPLPTIEGAHFQTVDLASPTAIAQTLDRHPADAIISCMASRTGTPKDAWTIDHQAHVNALEAAQSHGAKHFILLSAICVQKPLLAFQHAKLAFESRLIASGLTYSIVRPTAYFKSLSGQIDRLKRDKPYLLFQDGTKTACKPISDHDLATYLADCLTTPTQQNRILPIGGPGPPITPRQQGETLFQLLGKKPRYRQVPIALLDTIIATLTAAARFAPARLAPALAAKAELARIGRYYATESMLLLDPETNRYDPAATPETGTETLPDHYRSLIDGTARLNRGDHAVF